VFGNIARPTVKTLGWGLAGPPTLGAAAVIPVDRRVPAAQDHGRLLPGCGTPQRGGCLLVQLFC
jgi:hypothetical protein